MTGDEIQALDGAVQKLYREVDEYEASRQSHIKRLKLLRDQC